MKTTVKKHVTLCFTPRNEIKGLIADAMESKMLQDFLAKSIDFFLAAPEGAATAKSIHEIAEIKRNMGRVTK